MSIKAKVSFRVKRMKRGTPFSIERFYSLGSRTAVQKAMSRLTQEKVVERVSKGFYVRPKPLTSMPSITVTASAEQVAYTWAKVYGYKITPQGLEAAYRLGLQAQAPIKTILWTNGPTRLFTVWRDVVEIRHVTEQKLRWIGLPEGELLRAFIVIPAKSVELATLQAAFKRLSLSNGEMKDIVKKLRSVPLAVAWQNKLKQLEAIIS